MDVRPLRQGTRVRVELEDNYWDGEVGVVIEIEPDQARIHFPEGRRSGTVTWLPKKVLHRA